MIFTFPPLSSRSFQRVDVGFRRHSCCCHLVIGLVERQQKTDMIQALVHTLCDAGHLSQATVTPLLELRFSLKYKQRIKRRKCAERISIDAIDQSAAVPSPPSSI